MESKDKSILDTLKHIEDEIASTLEELSSIKESMEEKTSEETNRVFKFIFNLQRSGFSEQFDTSESIQKHYGFSKEKAEKFIFNYIEHLSEVTEKFSGSNSVASESASHASDLQAPQKKRKGPKPYSEMTPEELILAKARKLEKAKLAATPVTTSSPAPTSSPQQSPSLTSLEGQKPKRVIKTKKMSDGIQVWNSFLKVAKVELDASGVSLSYEDLVKKAKEMKEADPTAYQLFASTWTPDDDTVVVSSSSNA